MLALSLVSQLLPVVALALLSAAQFDLTVIVVKCHEVVRLVFHPAHVVLVVLEDSAAVCQFGKHLQRCWKLLALPWRLGCRCEEYRWLVLLRW